MKLDLKPLLKRLHPFINLLRRDSVGIFLVIVAIIFGSLIWRIGTLTGAEPSQADLNERLKSVIRPRIDPKSIQKIQDLQAENVDIQSYFSDRDNPFQE